MNEIIIIMVICIITIIILKFALNVKIKPMKQLNSRENKELRKIAEKFPEDTNICKDILKLLGNNNVKISINREYNSCLYTIYNNTITIGKFRENYMKVQTIAHECIHACQSKLTLWFNFIISNIYNLYFIVLLLCALFNKLQYTYIHLYILTIISFIQYIIRNKLENEAMLKAPYLAKQYMEEINIITSEEKEELLSEYNYINEIGIPFMEYSLIIKKLVNIIIFCICILV